MRTRRRGSSYTHLLISHAFLMSRVRLEVVHLNHGNVSGVAGQSSTASNLDDSNVRPAFSNTSPRIVGTAGWFDFGFQVEQPVSRLLSLLFSHLWHTLDIWGARWYRRAWSRLRPEKYHSKNQFTSSFHDPHDRKQWSVQYWFRWCSTFSCTFYSPVSLYFRE